MTNPTRRCFTRFALVLALTIGIGFVASGCAAMTQSLQAQRSYDQGRERYQAKDYAGAIPHLERALGAQPDFDEAEALLAWSYYHVAKYPEATKHFRQALARKPQWEGLHGGLGWTRYRVGRYQLALESFRQALALDRNYRDAAVGYAYTLFDLGRYAEAVSHLERLTKEGEGGMLQSPASDVGEVRSRFAWTLFYLGDYAKAREQFTKGIAARPEWSGLHNGLGWTFLRLGDKVQARRSFQRAVDLKPDLADAREGLAQLQP
jgi:tetratricopeptide (TPR) repeat protein